MFLGNNAQQQNGFHQIYQVTWLAALPAIATARGLFVGNENFAQLHHTRLQITSAPSRDAVKLPASAAQLRREFVL